MTAIPLNELPEEFRPLTARDFFAMAEMGLFGDAESGGADVELLGGIIFTLPPERAEHATPIRRLTTMLVLQLGTDYEVGANAYFVPDELSAPRPDLFVVPAGAYTRRVVDGCLLVIEVALSTHRKDLGEKARRYGRADVGEYWVIDVPGRSATVHRDSRDGRWRTVEHVMEGEVAEVSTLPGVSIDLGALFEGIPPLGE